MRLPGGLESAAGIEREFAFRPLTGGVELAVAESAQRPDTLPADRVTAALSACLEHVGQRPVDRATVDALCGGDRQVLMHQLAAHAEPDTGWLLARCAGCKAEFDLFIQQGSLPVKPAGPGFPYADVDTEHGRCRFRVPNGGDQCAVSASDTPQALQALMQRCLVDSPGDSPGASRDIRFSDEDRVRIEAALDEVAPQATTEALATCPECSLQNAVALNPYAVLDALSDSIVEEVHTLAWHYHWSEQAILDLPRSRRRQYLALIERARRGTQSGGQPQGAPAWAS